MLSNFLPSVGIIGGSDGPTAVFVTGDWRKAIALGAAAVLVVLGAVLTMIVRNRKK